MINKKGLSDVVTTVILIVITISAISIVWVVINNVVGEKLEETKSCFDIFGKVEINDVYTCYRTSDEELDVSINTKVSLDELLVSISSKKGSKSFKLTKEGSSESFVRPYGDNTNYGDSLRIPSEGEGLTYVVNVLTAGIRPNPEDLGDFLSINIVPSANGKVCDVADSYVGVKKC